MQEIEFYLVDAFSDKTFGGNAAAVCPLEEWVAGRDAAQNGAAA
jgi:Phenazine biosynthesis-like protein.